MSSLTGLKRADGQRVSLLLGSLLGGSTIALNYAARHPSSWINRVFDTVFPVVAGGHGRDVPHRELEVDGGGGVRLPARLYEPADAAGGLLVFFHGGGFVVGSLRTHGPTAAFTAEQARCKVLAVAYRKAPRHRFPTALEDCLAAFRWAVRNAAELGVDPSRIAVGGDSAGGQLAAAVCLSLGRGGPRPCCAWLIYPLVDGDIAKYRSADQFARGPLLTRRNSKDMVDHYATGPRQLLDPRLTLIEAENLDAMPPTYIATAGMDPIRDQGEAFAERLRAAGVAVELRRFENLPHGFDLLLVDRGARDATAETCRALGRALA